jgi:uncharacterized membrane protein
MRFVAMQRTHVKDTLVKVLFFILLAPQLFLVSVYPIFSVRSYFNSLLEYKGLDGLAWFAEQYPDDAEGVKFLHLEKELWKMDGANEKKGDNTVPVIVEADGDSYTDYARYSAYTGLPTVIGWAVHEWLWRGSYDVVAPRREDVRLIYESTDLAETTRLLKQYDVSYVIVGAIEREKYVNLNESKFFSLGDVVFQRGKATIFKVDRERWGID